MRHPHVAPGTVGALPVAMVEAALGALLVPVSGGAETAGAARLAAGTTAVGLAAIARAAQEEGLAAEAAGPDPQNIHGPLGPEMSGGQGTDTHMARRTDWGDARGPPDRALIPRSSGRGSLPKNRSARHSAVCCGPEG